MYIFSVGRFQNSESEPEWHEDFFTGHQEEEEEEEEEEEVDLRQRIETRRNKPP